MRAASARDHPGPASRSERSEPVVRAIWLAAAQPGGKRLAPGPAAMAATLLPAAPRQAPCPAAGKLLRALSPAPLDRRLAPARTP